MAESRLRLKHELLNQLLYDPRLWGTEAQTNELRTTLQDALTQHRNATVLLFGSRGSGKTSTLRHVLQEITPSQTSSASSADSPAFRPIWLDALDFGNDLRASKAWAKTARQIKKRDAEMAGLVPGANTSEYYASFVEKAIRLGRASGSPLLFVLDHLELFAQEPRQSFLYSLLDLASRPDVQLVIVGIARDFALREILEKRVRSRLASAKEIHFFKRSSADAMEMLRDLLTLPVETQPPLLLECDVTEGEVVGSPSKGGGGYDVSGDAQVWNAQWQLLHASPQFGALIERHVGGLGRSMKWLRHAMAAAITSAGSANQNKVSDRGAHDVNQGTPAVLRLSVTDVETALHLNAPYAAATMCVESFSGGSPEVAILAVVVRLTRRNKAEKRFNDRQVTEAKFTETQGFTFRELEREYDDFTQHCTGTSAQVQTKVTLELGFRKLLRLNLLLPVNVRTHGDRSAGSLLSSIDPVHAIGPVWLSFVLRLSELEEALHARRSKGGLSSWEPRPLKAQALRWPVELRSWALRRTEQ
uniref:Orc1-like AAA ATPase domain-containing protein n=1 Tax=Octactis speculum TaxID=3111310 RepID=A0A7S2HNW4_9STRA|mmetsp:Transcript_8075/g.10134  ORF Transcript_8075/g.10134 Transcript_8075/m.10134 type:complete len:531 (+) Transcript_8075:21-1613(+)|eukprot:CAMPEP_0185753948 /NCGR_PEP_ID=MMETSP1174-20130828/12620_1 /TAXON_ID=35687 /ORGANISM="Dictyocha speculum, Strain CCMP1381" /LENGTH=530 /DNA_ID=CAMNT_0028431977 /DNA_START=20 /DNA_END=1612 /DNA_ORIENTATION=-